jgi:GAF domain-containing protein
LSHIARQLQSADGAAPLLDEVVAEAIHLIPGCTEGSIAAVVGRKVQHKAASTELARQVDAAMEETGQGPCLDAIRIQRTLRVPDLRLDTRWPRFAERAGELGVRSLLSLQLYVRGETLGALNLYSREPGAFTDESEDIGLLYATHAALAYAAVHQIENLGIAIERRASIGTAIGILMHRYGLSSDRAFQVLVRFSQSSNRKLAEVAAEIVADPYSELL